MMFFLCKFSLLLSHSIFFLIMLGHYKNISNQSQTHNKKFNFVEGTFFYDIFFLLFSFWMLFKVLIFFLLLLLLFNSFIFWRSPIFFQQKQLKKPFALNLRRSEWNEVCWSTELCLCRILSNSPDFPHWKCKSETATTQQYTKFLYCVVLFIIFFSKLYIMHKAHGHDNLCFVVVVNSSYKTNYSLS